MGVGGAEEINRRYLLGKFWLGREGSSLEYCTVCAWNV